MDNIPGVGQTRKKALLRHFGSMRAIQEATVEALMDVPKIPKDLAVRIHQEFGSDPDGVQK